MDVHETMYFNILWNTVHQFNLSNILLSYLFSCRATLLFFFIRGLKLYWNIWGNSEISQYEDSEILKDKFLSVISFFPCFFLLFGFYYLSTSCLKVNFLWVTMMIELFPILVLILFILHQPEWSMGTSPQTQPVWVSKPGGRHKGLKSWTW